MRIRSVNELLIIIIWTILLLLAITLFPSNVLRLVLGLPFVVFFPGYTLIALLFLRKADLDGIERVALSFGLSIAVVPLVGFILNYTPWGIRLYPMLVSISLFIGIVSAIAWLRRNRLPPEDRFGVSFNFHIFKWKGKSASYRTRYFAIGAMIVAAIGVLVFAVATNHQVGEKFTEFYILGLDGKIGTYPKRLILGWEGNVIVSIVNQERQETTYLVEVTIDGVRNQQIGPVVLTADEKYQEVVGFKPTRVGEKQRVEFFLYKVGQAEPYSTLGFWIDVIKIAPP